MTIPKFHDGQGNSKSDEHTRRAVIGTVSRASGVALVAGLLSGGAKSALALDYHDQEPAGDEDAPEHDGHGDRFVLIRLWELQPDYEYSDIVPGLEDELIPALQQLEGFVAYYHVDTGNGTFAAISVFTNEDDADASGAIVMDFVAERYPDTTTGEPTALRGFTGAHADPAERGD